MSKSENCEYCGRTIQGEHEIRIRRGKKHVYCSDFCFKLHFYDAPTISYEDLQNMYKLRCVSVKLD
jgi:hypothetical protein